MAGAEHQLRGIGLGAAREDVVDVGYYDSCGYLANSLDGRAEYVTG